MFLYALKGPLYVTDHNEIVSCSECFRKVASDRPLQMKAKSKEGLMETYGMGLGEVPQVRVVLAEPSFIMIQN